MFSLNNATNFMISTSLINHQLVFTQAALVVFVIGQQFQLDPIQPTAYDSI
jgi:hypothetical protein